MKMLYTLLSFVGVGALFIGLAIPLMQRRIKPNHWYGFRTPKTLSDEAIWYDANAYSAKGLFAAGAATIGGALLFYVSPFMSPDRYVFVCMGVMLVALVINVVTSFLYLKRLTK